MEPFRDSTAMNEDRQSVRIKIPLYVVDIVKIMPQVALLESSIKIEYRLLKS